MGLLNDIMTIIKSSDTVDELKKNLTSKKYSSIATRASEGTLQFPVLVSDSMDIETIQMVTRALERNFSTFVQTVLTMNSVSQDTDIATYLRQFHQNFSPASNPATTANIVKTFTEGYTFSQYESGDVIAMETYNNTTTPKVNFSNREQNVNLLEDLRVDILNRKFTPRNEVIYNFKNANTSRRYNLGESYVPPTDVEVNREVLRKGIRPTDSRYDEYANAFRDEHRKAYDNAQKKNQYADVKAVRDAERHNVQLAKDKLNVMQTAVDLKTRTIPNQMLKDNDAKKANELVATTLHARVHMVNKDGEPIGSQDFILGIKGTMHPIKSEEMIDNMVGACKNNNKVFNFLRWTTGEISFFKDFWLNTSEMKRDVANESRGASRWWIALKNRKDLGKMSTTAFVKNKILPNATIVISAEEAEIIRTHYGYDVMNPYFIKKIMETYYLLGFVVVDNSAQIAHFFFDGATDFESVSFSGLEKENTRDERKFKEMLKVINRN